MCFDFKTSVVTSTIGIASASAAFYLKQPILGSLILCYSLMQFSEVLIWKGINDKNDNLNRLGTNIGKWTLPAHNIAIGIGILIAYNDVSEVKYWIPLMVGLVFYAIVVLVYYLPIKKNQLSKSCTSNKKCGFGARLSWGYPSSWYTFGFIISLIIMCFYVEPLNPSAIIIGTFFAVTYLGTYFISRINNTFGSLWCWSTAILAPVLVFLNWYFTKDLKDVKT